MPSFLRFRFLSYLITIGLIEPQISSSRYLWIELAFSHNESFCIVIMGQSRTLEMQQRKFFLLILYHKEWFENNLAKMAKKIVSNLASRSSIKIPLWPHRIWLWFSQIFVLQKKMRRESKIAPPMKFLFLKFWKIFQNNFQFLSPKTRENLYRERAQLALKTEKTCLETKGKTA